MRNNVRTIIYIFKMNGNEKHWDNTVKHLQWYLRKSFDGYRHDKLFKKLNDTKITLVFKKLKCGENTT